MNILITGCAGFIGSHLTDALVAQGHRVIGLDNLSTGVYQNLNEKIVFNHLDICDSRLDSVFDNQEIDYVFHLAAQINLRHSLDNFHHDANVNILGSLNLIQSCLKHKVKKFIFSSTGGAIYAPGSLPWTEHSYIGPKSPYGMSKRTVENYLSLLRDLKNLDSVSLRYSNVYGPRQISKSEAGVISIFINAALQDKPLNIFGDGEQTRDMVSVYDVVRANLLAMEKETPMPAYNVSSNSQMSVNQLAQMILEEIGSDSEINRLPRVDGEVMHTQLSYREFQAKTGWAPQVTLNQGIKQTVEWFRINKGNK